MQDEKSFGRGSRATGVPAVVRYLYQTSWLARATMQGFDAGVTSGLLLPYRACGIVAPGRKRCKDRTDRVNHSTRVSCHQTIAVLRPPDSAVGAGVDMRRASRFRLLRPLKVVNGVRVAS